jgi:negative regulator of flagellin synthesis FlgM
MNSIGPRSPWGLTPQANSLPARVSAGPADRLKPRAADLPARVGAGAVVRDLAASPPVDAGRVAALRAAIADGSFRIDADAIAGAMLKLDRRG